jgi:hypothetical protein
MRSGFTGWRDVDEAYPVALRALECLLLWSA